MSRPAPAQDDTPHVSLEPVQFRVRGEGISLCVAQADLLLVAHEGPEAQLVRIDLRAPETDTLREMALGLHESYPEARPPLPPDPDPARVAALRSSSRTPSANSS